MPRSAATVTVVVKLRTSTTTATARPGPTAAAPVGPHSSPERGRSLAVGVEHRRDATGRRRLIADQACVLRSIAAWARAWLSDHASKRAYGDHRAEWRRVASGPCLPSRSPTSSPPCARRAACSPRTRRGCCRAARSPAELDALVARRVAGEPLEQLLGWAEFCGLRIAVDARGVRAPAAHRVAGRRGRRRWPGRAPSWSTCAAAPARSAPPSPRRCPGVELHAADVDPAAVACARRNLPRPGVRGRPYDAAAGRAARAGSTCWSPTRPTCPPTRSR